MKSLFNVLRGDAIADGYGFIRGNFEGEFEFVNPLKLFMLGGFVNIRRTGLGLYSAHISVALIVVRGSMGWQKERFVA